MSGTIHRLSEYCVSSFEAMEDSSSGCVSICDSCLDPERCLASKLWRPFKIIVCNPVYSAVILLILYVVFIIAYVPFWLISFVVTSWGSLFVLFYLLVWGLRAFARTMSFPGSSKSLQRDFSLDYIRRTVQQIDMFGTLSSNFAVLIANSGKTRGRLNINGAPSPHRAGSNKYEDPVMYKAAELEAWCDEMTHLHVCLSDAIEDYRYTAYKQSSSGQESGLGGTFGGLRGASSPVPASKNLQRGAAFTFNNLFSFRGLGKMADKVTEKLFVGVGICTGKSPVKKSEINEVLNPAIVVRDSFGSLLEHTGNLLRGYSAQGDTYVSPQHSQPQQQQPSTPPRRERSASSASTASTVGSPGSEVAELVASISMVIRYSDQLRNALMYMLVQSEHNEEKRKEMNDRIAPTALGAASSSSSSSSSRSASQVESGEDGLSSILEVSASSGSNGGFLGNLTKQIAPGSQIVNSLLYMNQGPHGPANLSFGLMRAQLTHRCGAYRFRVVGCDDNVVDCIYVTARGFQDAYGDRETSSEGCGSRKGQGRSSGGVDQPLSSARGDRGSSDSLNSTSSGDGADSSSSTGSGSGSEPGSATQRGSGGGAPSSEYILDGLPSSRSRSRSHSGYGSSITKPVPSEVGTVLFCGPNAGMYESFSMASPDSSWLGYYTQLGLDVAFFNYRGYNLSTGLPQPEGIQNDGIYVMEYLKTILGVRSVIVHGESIGGMVATSLARHFDCSTEDTSASAASAGGSSAGSASYNNLGDMEQGQEQGSTRFRIKMLVCDRTFASLDSVAARFLGVWAAYGLVYLGPWQTDCVTSYLEADTDMKVIIQDPEDAIIDHSASLKTGVATYCTTGEVLWWPRAPLNAGYRKSILLREMPSFDPDATQAPFKLDARFVEAVCVSIIALAQQAQSGVQETVEAGQPYDADSSLGDNSTGSTGTSASEDSSSRKGGGGGAGGGGQFLSMRAYRPTREWLRLFCSQSVAEANTALTPVEKAFLVIASLDGRCGEMCGHALIGGFDNLFPFMCQLVHWSPRSFGSTRTLGKGGSSNHIRNVGRNIHRVCEDLEALVYGQQQPNGLGAHAGVLFLRSAMHFLRDKVLEVEANAKRAHAAGKTVSDAPGAGTGAAGVGAEGTSTNSVAVFSPPRGKGVPPTTVDRLVANVAVGTSLAEESVPGGKQQTETLGESVPSPAGPMSPGFLINVNCGHSGWPSKKALDTLTLCVSQAGFNIKKVPS